MMYVAHSPIRVWDSDPSEIESGATNKKDKHREDDQQRYDPVYQSNLTTLGFGEVNYESPCYHSSTSSRYGCRGDGLYYHAGNNMAGT